MKNKNDEIMKWVLIVTGVIVVLLVAIIIAADSGFFKNSNLKIKNVTENIYHDWIEGEIENTSNNTYEDVKIYIDYYNYDDTKIEDWEYINKQINPNSTIEFTIIPPDEWDGDRYEIKSIE